MATHTTYYNLTKPAQNDKVNIGVLNDNADIIDTALHNKVDLDDLTADKVMLSDGVTSVEDRLDAHTVGTGVDIKSYTSTPYVAPSDGYVIVQSGGKAGGRNIVNIGGINNAIVQRTPGAEQGTAGTYFVRKGTEILEVGDNSGTGGSTYFYPLQ